MMFRKGLIQIYTGNGKGKTTAALGLALRATGQGFNVLILQSMKRQKNIGEIKVLESTNLPIKIEQYGRSVFFKTRTCEPMDIHMAHRGLRAFEKAMENGQYDMIILDEINTAIHFGLLKIEEVIRIIAKKPPNLHLILTGRKTAKELIEMSDLVTEMREIKHHYNKGVIAQKGIEY
ncbi:MAG: cob(I)yrinic acid a,c-diamide adenosyltransferase [Deltaproteobacteria bacterium]|nr:MAG: cob(I)yrinic acid a,c-diamide adenosyltransferase [Deltaproteobacteria bacterium]